jgi:diguanylate cyclase (GGDEF)-like protein/PAS domain S-box-containing protein
VGDGPTGRCIRLRTPQICRSIADDPLFEPWREHALRFGYMSSIALPLICGTDCIGALNVYSESTQSFAGEELELLNELSGDIAYGIGALRTRCERQRAESQLRLFRDLLDRSNDLIYVVDAHSARIVDANDAVIRSLGYGREELLAMRLPEFSLTARLLPWPERLRQIESAGSLVFEGELRRKDGSTLPVETSLSYVRHDHTPYLLSVSRDISERLRQQTLIAHISRVARMQSSINSAVLRIRERRELLQEVCRVATDVGGYDRAVVSLVDPGGRTATPAIRSGRGIDFPEPEALTIGDGTEPDTSLTSRALRIGQIVVCSNLAKSETPVAMRDQVVALGFKIIVAIPFIVDGTRIGCLTLASRDPTFVGNDEMLLLQDIAATLSFALRLQRQADAFEFLASYDSLTGLAKRALLCSRLDAVLAGNTTAQSNPLVVALDVHHLSDINDTYGRRFGDLLLQTVAERLRHGVDDDDRVGYLGGGTFVLIQPQLLASEQNINAFLADTVFGEQFSIDGHDIRISCRYGVARYPTDGGDSDTLVQKAEAALKHAKDTGEGYLHYKLEIHSKIAERLALENRLRNAIDAREFELYYQPQVNVLTGELEVLEALLRWNDPLRGQVLPADFLGVLESSGMIVAVGRWVLKSVVQDVLRWEEAGYRACRVAVNVSPIQVRQRQFVPVLLELSAPLREGRSRWGLDIEITESAMLQDLDGTSHKLRELRAAGVRVAIDDFGTGYSALGLLSKLPVDILKIDRSFVGGLPSDPASVTLARSIIGLASAFGLKTVAEGVETREQLELLRNLHCDYSQGFFHSRPLAPAEMERMLSK